MRFETQVVLIEEILDWDRRGQLVLNPDFQRRDVWSPHAKSYFLDTLMRGLPTHKIFIREYVKQSQSFKEVVDGQQRLKTILDYIKGLIKIDIRHNKHVGDKFYHELSYDVKYNFLNYVLAAEFLYDAKDAEVLQLFARLNTYTVRLNKQELRNANYHGEFKKLIYSLSDQSIDFYMKYRILTRRSISRMGEAELISELIISMMDGVQDKKLSIDKFYRRYNRNFPEYNKYYDQYWDIIDIIDTNFGNVLKKSVFRRKVMFYSLFLSLYDIKYGLPKEKGPYTLTKKFSEAIELFDIVTSIIRNPDSYQQHSELITACARQTDNINPRKIRHNFIVDNMLQFLR